MATISDNGDITIRRRESFNVRIDLVNDDGVEDMFIEGDIVIFAVGKCCPRDAVIVKMLEAIPGTSDILIPFINNDTGMQGNFKYDAVLKRGDMILPLLPLRDFYIDCGVA